MLMKEILLQAIVREAADDSVSLFNPFLNK
jgi:hypothetical protein